MHHPPARDPSPAQLLDFGPDQQDQPVLRGRDRRSVAHGSDVEPPGRHSRRGCDLQGFPDHEITFTRSRPGNKNDGAHVEQKNWARVRELVGYLRYDAPAELALLNEIWELDRIFTNYLLPQQKLLSKHRYGAKVSKKHDAGAAPHQRAIRHEKMRKRPIITMNAAFKRIKPAALSRQILDLTGRLETLSVAKKPAPAKPVVNRAYNA